jgi:hypothetical protein
LGHAYTKKFFETAKSNVIKVQSVSDDPLYDGSRILAKLKTMNQQTLVNESTLIFHHENMWAMKVLNSINPRLSLRTQMKFFYIVKIRIIRHPH